MMIQSSMMLKIHFRATTISFLGRRQDNHSRKSLKITAIAEDDGEIMGVSHKKYLIEGVQFHPESIMTPMKVKKFLRTSL